MSKETPKQVMAHQEQCKTCNKTTEWVIYTKIAKKGPIVNVLLECTGCGDLLPMSATLTNLRNTFGLKVIDEKIGKLPL